MLVNEPASHLHKDGLHLKLAHDHFTGPWKVENVVRQGLSLIVILKGPHMRQGSVAASYMTRFTPGRTSYIHHEFFRRV